MAEFNATSPEVQLRRESDYSPIDADTAACVAELLDHIIDSVAVHRQALADGVGVTEQGEASLLFAARYNDNTAILWPLNKMHLRVHRQTEHHGVFAGDGAYAVVLGWMALRDDIIDPGYRAMYRLLQPHDPGAEVPKFQICYDQSAVASSTNGVQASVGTIGSSYHEVDTLLEKSFYHWQQGSVYDAELLFDQLALFDIAALRR